MTRRNPGLPQPLYKATVTRSAVAAVATDSLSTVTQEVLTRIQKCWSLGTHPTTAPSEAETALRMAHRIMSEYNISLADATGQSVGLVNPQRGEERSVVLIHRNDHDLSKQVQREQFVKYVQAALSTFFDCSRATYGKEQSLEIRFHGPAANTAAAASAFETFYNMTVDGARAQKGVGPKTSYCLGAAMELIRNLRSAKASETAAAKEAEQASLPQVQSGADHLLNPGGWMSGSNNSLIVSSRPQGCSSTSHTQLTVMHQQAKNVAPELARAVAKRKQRRRSRQPPKISDFRAYQAGVLFARSFDLNRKRISNE